MPPSPRKWIPERLSVTSSVRCVAWLKGVLCSHLRSLWMLLMALTVVCVAIQIFGVVWQSRNDKLLSERLLNLRFPADVQRPPPALQKDWRHLRSEPAPAVRGEVRSLGRERTQRERAIQRVVDLYHRNNVEPMAERHQGRPRPSKDTPSRNIDKPAGKNADSWTDQSPVSTGETVLAKGEAYVDKVDAGRLGSPVVLRPEGALSQMPGSHSTSDSRVNDKAPHLHPVGKSLITPHVPRSLNLAAPSSSSDPRLSSAVPSPGACRPRDHIVFLKTHKTASSTLLNILYRYGDSRNLTFALPLNKHSQLFYPFFFAAHFVEGVRTRTVNEFHVMCNHMRFKKSEVSKVMPGDTFYFSILRHPVAMMESIFIYYKSIPAFHKARSLDDFLDLGWRDYNTSQTNNHYARNILAFDFGFDNNVSADAQDFEERVSTAVSAIEQDFDLILISEYFDESMILLKHALCWSLDDVVSFKLNSRSERTRHTLSSDTAAKIKTWNALDWRFYLHFNATFWQRVDSWFGRETMRREVSRLRERRAQLAKTCLQDGVAVDPSQIKDAGLKPFQYGAAVIQGYNLNPDLDGPTRTRCQNLVTPELQYTDALYTKQFPELAARQRKAAKMAASQRQAGANRTAMTGHARGREAPLRRTVRSGVRDVREHMVPPENALSKRAAPQRHLRNVP